MHALDPIFPSHHSRIENCKQTYAPFMGRALDFFLSLTPESRKYTGCPETHRVLTEDEEDRMTVWLGKQASPTKNYITNLHLVVLLFYYIRTSTPYTPYDLLHLMPYREQPKSTIPVTIGFVPSKSDAAVAYRNEMAALYRRYQLEPHQLHKPAEDNVVILPTRDETMAPSPSPPVASSRTQEPVTPPRRAPASLQVTPRRRPATPTAPASPLQAVITRRDGGITINTTINLNGLDATVFAQNLFSGGLFASLGLGNPSSTRSSQRTPSTRSRADRFSPYPRGTQ